MMKKHQNRRPLILGAALLGLAAIAAGLGFSARDGQVAPTQASAAADQSSAAPAKTAPAATGQVYDGYSDIMLGKKDAPISVIEYASMTCGHCADFQANVFPEFKKHYIDTGRANYVLRHFVLNGPDLVASMLARCAPTDRYYAMVDLFLARQASWIAPWQELGQPTADTSLADLALQAKMDAFVRPTGMAEATVKACLASDKLRNDILRQRNEGLETYKITGTPTLIINGKVYEGEQTFEALSKALNALK